MFKFPAYTENAVWGAVIGAIAITFFGFQWGGWQTAGKVESIANQKVAVAVQSILTPLCVDMFKKDAKYKDNLVELKKIDEWSRDKFIEKGGWGKVTGANDLDADSSKACATQLTQ
jgi:hypothetical protein